MARRTLWWFPLSAALVLGCAPGNPGLVVMNVVAPNDQCNYDVSNPMLATGTYDLESGAPYVAYLRFGNQLINLGESGTSGPPRADPNVVVVQEIEVELRDAGGNLVSVGGLPNPVTLPAGGGAIPSSDGTTFGEGIGAAELIPAAYGAALAGSADGTIIIVGVRAVGRTLGDAELVSNEFAYPVRLCTGCLLPACPVGAETQPCAPACLPGQDQVDLRCTPDCTIGG